ncbi:MAG: anion permease, partial [Rhodobiaceae bacterium]|nr:anion permease [Rhodobiaceae bacterium]
LILIFAMLAIGAGLQKTGAIQLLADHLMPLMSGLSPFWVLIAIYLFANLLTEFITNNAVAVILTPLVITLAESLHMDARALAITVMFGASSSFATPIGYQTNTMVYGAGNYRFVDFMKIGVPIVAITCITSCTMIWLLYF